MSATHVVMSPDGDESQTYDSWEAAYSAALGKDAGTVIYRIAEGTGELVEVFRCTEQLEELPALAEIKPGIYLDVESEDTVYICLSEFATTIGVPLTDILTSSALASVAMAFAAQDLQVKYIEGAPSAGAGA